MALKMNDNDQDNIMSEINMTPLIDIMLVLLIIFMVTSSITLESGLDIDIPKTKSKTTSHKGNAVIISLNSSGQISVQGKKTSMDTLEIDIKAALISAKSSLVVFEGDQSSKLGSAIEIMDIAKAAGAEKFAIAADSNN